jgi:folate-dependent phosphoribosylglycinamide formyltransferase PurN
MNADLGGPIRVVMFGGPYLHAAAVEFAALLEQHPEIELLFVLCQGTGQGFRHRLGNLVRRRGLAAVPVLALEWVTAFRSFVRDPRAARGRSHAARALAKIVTVPDVHASDVLERVRAARPDLGVIYGAPILQPELYEIPAFGTLGIHHGRLPRYRGKKTTFWEMYNGEAVAGVAIQRVNRGIDTGDLAKTGCVAVGRKSYSRVEREVELLGFSLYLEAILDVKAGLAHYRAQDPGTLGGRMYRQPSPADILRFWLRRRARPQRGVERP